MFSYVLPAAVIVGGVAVVLLISMLIAADRRDQFGNGSFDDIQAALTTHKMKICTTIGEPHGRANQAIESQQYDVAFSCPTENDAQVIVDRFGSAEDRDAAVRNLEVLVRPRGNGVAYTYGPFTIYVQGHSGDKLQDRIDAALRGIGAN